MSDCNKPFIKIYPIYQLNGIDFSKPLEEPSVLYWEINFDCDQKDISLKRHSRFQSIEEAIVICQLAGYECKKCKWLPYPTTIDSYGRIEFEKKMENMFQKMNMIVLKENYIQKDQEKNT